jgi:hypothetical protein
MDDLRANYLVKDLTAILDDLMPVFISSHEQAPVFPHRCSISRSPLISPVALPCHNSHKLIMNEASLVKFSIWQMKHDQKEMAESLFKDVATLEKLKESGGQVSCPCCNKKYDPLEEAIKDKEWLTSAKEKSFKEYPLFLEELKLFNIHLNEQVVKQKLDDRHIIQEALNCPLSKKLLSDPVITSCGHTFDKSSIVDKVKCPRDETALSLDKVVPNIIVKNFLISMNDCFSSIFCNLSDAKDISGVWLFLNKNSTVKRVETIAKQLGFYEQKPRWIPVFITAKGNNFGLYDYLKDYQEALEESPILKRANRQMY